MQTLRSTDLCSFQLEQTGTTIFQTLAGVALDIKTKKPAAESVSLAPHNGDDRDIQYLLNAFVILNVVQLFGIFGLRHLNRQQHKTTERLQNTLLSPFVEEEDVEPEGGKSPADEDSPWENEEPQPVIGRKRSMSLRISRSASASSPEQHIPLLRSPSQSSSRHGRLLSGVPDTPVRIRVTKKQLKRGEVFAVVSGLVILLAWVLFMGTAWLRLRSKEERGGVRGGE